MQLSIICKTVVVSMFLFTGSTVVLAAVGNTADGIAEISFSSYRSHDKTFSQNRNVSTWQTISASTRAMFQASEIRLGDDQAGQYGDLQKFATGFRVSGLKTNTSLWLDQYQSGYSFTGYRFDSRYAADEQTSIVLAVAKTPVIDLDTLGEQGRPLLTSNSYSLKTERILDANKDLSVGMTRWLYSDANKSTAYTWQYGQTIYDQGRDRLRIGAYGYKGSWDTVSQWYGNPLSSKSFGLTTTYGARDGNGQWTTTFTGAWGADDNNPLEFWPSLRLQYQYQASPSSSMTFGFASGLRTDKANELEGLRHNYRQFNAAYQANW